MEDEGSVNSIRSVRTSAQASPLLKQKTRPKMVSSRRTSERTFSRSSRRPSEITNASRRTSEYSQRMTPSDLLTSSIPESNTKISKLKTAGKLIGKLGALQNEVRNRHRLAWKDLKTQCQEILRYKKPGNRTESEIELLRRLLRDLQLFGDLSDQQALQSVCENMRLVSVEPDTPIYIQGQAGRYYRILLFGSVEEYHQNSRLKAEVLMRQYGNSRRFGPLINKDNFHLFGPKVLTVPEDKAFGDMLPGTNEHPTSAVSSAASNFLEIDYQSYLKLVRNSQDSTLMNIWKRCDFLSNLSLFKEMKGNTVSEIAYKLKVKSINRGEVLAKKGEQIKAIYIIRFGEANVKEEVIVSSMDLYYEERNHQFDCIISKCVVGTLVGAYELLADQTEHSHTVIASSPVTLFEMDCSDILRLRKENLSACENYREQEEQRLKWREDSYKPLNIEEYMQRFTFGTCNSLAKNVPTQSILGSKDFSHYIQKNLRQLSIPDLEEERDKAEAPESFGPELSVSASTVRPLTSRPALLSSTGSKPVPGISPIRVNVPYGGSPTSTQKRRPKRPKSSSQNFRRAVSNPMPRIGTPTNSKESRAGLRERNLQKSSSMSPPRQDRVKIINTLEGNSLPSPRAFAFGLVDADGEGVPKPESNFYGTLSNQQLSLANALKTDQKVQSARPSKYSQG